MLSCIDTDEMFSELAALGDGDLYANAFPFGYSRRTGYEGVCCVDCRPGRTGQVVVLEGSLDAEAESTPLAPNVFAYVDAISELAFVNPLVARRGKFITKRAGGLDPTSRAGIARRRAFGIE